LSPNTAVSTARNPAKRLQHGGDILALSLLQHSNARDVPFALPEESYMNRDILTGQWKQLRGEVKRQWGKLTDDELDQAEGAYDKVAGKIQERYGYTRERAESELDSFLNEYSHDRPAR
jgi:uncharacterized protein YjbJ (UPF0337 family)